MTGKLDAALTSLELDTVLVAAVRELGKALGACHCVVVRQKDGELQVAAKYTRQAEPDISSATNGPRPIVTPFDLSRVFPTPESLVAVPDADNSDPETARLIRSFTSRKARSAIITPLEVGAQTVGALLVCYSSRKRRWSTREKQLIKAVTANLVLAISKIQYYEKAKSAVERESLTNRLLTAIRTAYNVDEVLRVAVSSLGSAMGVSRAAVYVRSDLGSSSPGNGHSSLTVRAEYRAADAMPSQIGTLVEIAGAPLLTRALGGEIVAVPDTGESSALVRTLGLQSGIRAILLAPIATNGATGAVLALEQHQEPRQFSDEEINLIRMVTDQTAVAIHQAELYREAQEAARRESLISKIGSAVHLSLDRGVVLQTIVDELGAALSLCRCRLALLPDPVPERLRITHQYVAPCCEGRTPGSDTIPSTSNRFLDAVLAGHRPVSVENVEAETGLGAVVSEVGAEHVKSMLGAPIWLGGRPIGVLILDHCERHHSWSKWEIDILQSVAEQAAVAIRQAEFYREARESATRGMLINQIVAAIRRSLDLEETLQATAEELGKAVKSNRVSVRKLVGDEMIVVAEYLSDPRLSTRELPAPASDYLSSPLATSRRTLIIDDLKTYQAVGRWRPDPQTLSQIVCPIFVNNRFWGALSIGQTEQIREWCTSEIALVEAVSAQMEVAVNHSHLFEEAKRAAKREALISRIIHGINQSNQLDEIFAIVARGLADHLEVDRLQIAKLNDESGFWTVESECSRGEVNSPRREVRYKEFSELVSSIRNGPIRCSDIFTDARVEPYIERLLEPPGARAFMAVRLTMGTLPRFAIIAIMNTTPRVWTDDDVDLVRAVADQVLIAVQRAELFEEVSRAKHEWEATFESLTDGVFIFDARGELRRVNQAGAAIADAKAHELIGRRCCSLLHEFEGASCHVAPVIDAGRPITFELVPERLARSLLVTISPLANGGHARGAVCIVRDLSELRAAEAAAREQRTFLIKLLEHANDAIFALSSDGRFIWFNEQLLRLTGYSREELVASSFTNLPLPHERQAAARHLSRAWAGESQTFEIVGQTKDRDARLLLVTYTPIYDEEKVSSVLSIARDITDERLAAERAAQADKLRALGQLASGVAHNFNNVLAAILGHAQLIKRDLKDSPSAQRVDIIERAALDGAQTVKRIQGFALQQNDTEFQLCEINQLVQDSANLTRARWCDDAQARGLSYDVDLKFGRTPQVLGSPSELREVFVNLILNALDAMPAGGRLVISTSETGSSVVVRFSDNGVGMSRQVRDRVFEPFFTTKSTAGMGLGLAVSYGIIDRHAGRIDVESEPGSGATFTISLPSARSAPKTAITRKSTRAPHARILVIDDDVRVNEALAGLLVSAGHDVHRASSGREGLAKLENIKMDVVITDLSMPDKDGWAVAAEIRRRWPSVRIVLTSGFAIPPDLYKKNRGLIDALVPKPIRIDDISGVLARVLSGAATAHR
ncbi:MAG TPA: GAF domain-containing protein [Blastocatellia bacterium]|nr:GAF domain-containing protein [Blastocatellia bacterium]